jgi:hypothetical protein
MFTYFWLDYYFKARDARRKRHPQACQLLLYTQSLQMRELSDPAIPPEVIGVRQWSDSIERLKRAHKGDVQVAVYPYVGIQHEVALAPSRTSPVYRTASVLGCRHGNNPFILSTQQSVRLSHRRGGAPPLPPGGP